MSLQAAFFPLGRDAGTDFELPSQIETLGHQLRAEHIGLARNAVGLHPKPVDQAFVMQQGRQHAGILAAAQAELELVEWQPGNGAQPGAQIGIELVEQRGVVT